jgi:hypothetical protein
MHLWRIGRELEKQRCRELVMYLTKCGVPATILERRSMRE